MLRKREASLEKPAGSYRVFAVGDSFTEGLGVEADQRFTAIVEKSFSTETRTVLSIAAGNVLRISLDAKAAVNVGPFARGGTSRGQTAAVNHHFQPEACVTPVGILVPTLAELFVYRVLSTVTSDCLADCLTQ